VRQYSRDRLLEAGEGTAVRERHLAFFHEEAERGQGERILTKGGKAQ
jgi:hypothetical protein